MTGEIRRILVAVDENIEGNTALQYGAYLANILKARLEVIHVIEEALIYQIWGAIVVKEEISEQRDRIDAEVERYRKKLKSDIGIRINEGLYPASEILKELHERDHDLLVIGSHGASVVIEFLLGSVSSEVIHNAKKPVIVVKEMREISNILVCTSGSKCSLDAIKFGAEIARAAKAHVTVLSVSELDMDDSIERALGFAHEGAEALAERGVSAKEIIAVGKPADEVLAEARRYDYDLIVMGHAGKSAVVDLILGEVASKVIHHSTRPTLIFRE
ncbi:MAG: universal stress protein [Thermoplasmata archaeon]|nr:universal stress protein [Thermoplasmata archaeon]